MFSTALAVRPVVPLQGGVSIDRLTQPDVLFPALFVLAFGGVGTYMLFKGVRSLARGGRVVSGEPVDAGDFHLEEGNVELEGEAQPLGETVSARYTGEEVLGYTYKRKERRRDHDPDGGTQTHWETVAEGGDAVPFTVVDETGQVAVDPEDADLTFDEENVGGGAGTRQYEGTLEPGSTVYVNGVKREVTEREGPLADERAVVAGGEDLVVSDTTEAWTAARYGLRGVGQVVFGLVFAAVGAFVAASMLGIPLPVDPGSFF